jgi:hypothetical protein
MGGLNKRVVIPYANVNELNAAYRRKAVSQKLYEEYLRILQGQEKKKAAAGKKPSLGD